jgi:hypothetical protein
MNHPVHYPKEKMAQEKSQGCFLLYMIFEIAAASSILSLNDDGQLKELTERSLSAHRRSRERKKMDQEISRILNAKEAMIVATGLYYYLSGRNQPQRKR